MNRAPSIDDLRALRDPAGGESRYLTVGDWILRLHGLESGLAESLDLRWGGFVSRLCHRDADLDLEFRIGERRFFLELERPGENYRIEPAFTAGGPLLRSYAFAACPAEAACAWRIALHPDPVEPADRTVDNAVRCLLGRFCIESGGFALHGAGVLRDGRAHIFAGKSNSGKTTAVSLSPGTDPLGDDYAVLLPYGKGWAVPAVPFDNSERAPSDPPRGLHPLEGVWRLFQSPDPRLEIPAGPAREASVLACVSHAETVADRIGSLLDNIGRFALQVRYGHLHFRKDPGFWDLIGGEG